MLRLFTIFLLMIAFSELNAGFQEIGFSDIFVKNENSTKILNNSGDYLIKSNFFSKIEYSHNLKVSGFPVTDDKYQDLFLKRIPNIIDYKSIFLVGNNNVDAPEMATYEGIVEGKNNSKVLMTIINGMVFTIIDLNKETKYFFPNADNEYYSFHDDAEINIQGVFNEDDNTDDFDQIMGIRKSVRQRNNTLSNDLLELELALETDTEFYKATGGDVDKAQAYILTLITQVSKIYQEFIDVRIKVTWLKTWTDNPADPYNAKGDFAVLRDKSMEYWENNYQDVTRDIYHVCTSISYGGGGFGYFNALCGNKKHGMSVTSLQCSNNLPAFSFAYDVYIIAHEIGHNFNAQHTHSCYWDDAPLDTCVVDKDCLPDNQEALPNPGSIMSYCGGINNQSGLGYQLRMLFRPENIEIMRTTAEMSPCLSKVEQPFVELLSPIGSEIIKNTSKLEIEWKAYNVDGVDLYYSTDNGSRWEMIEKNIDPDVASYSWEYTSICSKEVDIRITSSQDILVADTTMMPFTIISEDPEKLVVYYPLDGNAKDMQFCHLFDAENVNDVIFTEDRFSIVENAAEFSGTNYLYAPAFNAEFDELTVLFWFNAADLTGKKFLVGTNYSEGWVFSTYFWGQLGVSLYLDGKGAPDQIWAGGIQADKWHYFAATFDGNIAKVYLDGELKGEKAWEQPAKLNSFKSTPLYIGARKDNDYFTGKIDDVRIYNRALGIDEIMQLTGVDDSYDSDNAISIYPNPASDFLNLYTSKYLGDIDITVYDITGRIVINYSDIEIPERTPRKIDVHSLKEGIYFIKFSNGLKVRTEKFIILE